jgi:hypothetical protein
MEKQTQSVTVRSDAKADCVHSEWWSLYRQDDEWSMTEQIPRYNYLTSAPQMQGPHDAARPLHCISKSRFRKLEAEYQDSRP